MRSGAYKDLVTIEHVPEKSTGAGYTKENWQPFAEVLGAFRWFRGKESVDRGILHGQKVGEFRMPYLDGVNETMRIHRSDEGVDRYFRIVTSIDMGEARREMCLEIVEVSKEHSAR